MTQSYEEIVQGESLLRHPPGARHEQVRERLHQQVASCLQSVNGSRLLDPRTVVQLIPGTLIRPDLALVTAATNKPWLIAEVIDSGDHHSDTVTKKMLYEETRLPRLWMVDIRYDNVEVYHGTQYGLALKTILAQRDFLTEKLIPELNLALADLFREEAP